MAGITISREFGSEGDRIARKVAEALGYHFVDQEFVGVLLSQYGLVEFNREYESLPAFWQRFNAQREKRRDLMADMLRQVLRAVARHGDVVILGRSGYAVLAGFADVLHVRLQAPLPVRVARVMAQESVPGEEAEALVRNSDKVRAAFVEEFYGVPWGEMHAFDLVIDTGKISPDLAAAWVVDAARALAAGPPPDQPTTASIEVDSVLAGAVCAALGCPGTHG